MKRLLIFASLLFLSALAAPLPMKAQQTVVTATVKDPNGIPYANGTVQASLQASGRATVTISNQAQCSAASAGTAPCQVPIPGNVGPVSIDSTGTFVMTLYSNTSITPAASKWLFTINISPGIPLPLGTGPQTFSVAVTVTGATQNLSATLSAAAPSLTNFAGTGPGGCPGTAVNPQLFFDNMGTCAGVLGSAVTAATGAITLTAGADTTTPLIITQNSSAQSVDTEILNGGSLFSGDLNSTFTAAVQASGDLFTRYGIGMGGLYRGLFSASQNNSPPGIGTVALLAQAQSSTYFSSGIYSKGFTTTNAFAGWGIEGDTYALVPNGQTNNDLQIGIFGYAENKGTGGTVTDLQAGAFGAETNTGTTTTNQRGILILRETQFGTIANNYGLEIQGMNDQGGTLNAALHIQDQTSGATDYALLSEGGKSLLKSSSDAQTPLTVTSHSATQTAPSAVFSNQPSAPCIDGVVCVGGFGTGAIIDVPVVLGLDVNDDSPWSFGIHNRTSPTADSGFIIWAAAAGYTQLENNDNADIGTSITLGVGNVVQLSGGLALNSTLTPTVTAFQGTDTHALTSGTVSAATGVTLCTDASHGGTTTGCTSAFSSIISCGTTAACGNTAVTSPRVVTGTVTTAGGTPTATVTGISPAFTSSASYVCTISINDTFTGGTAQGVTNVSGSSFTLYSSIAGPVNYICIGN